jgi:multicomponent Na+:H+ antiporter subunit E
MKYLVLFIVMFLAWLLFSFSISTATLIAGGFFAAVSAGLLGNIFMTGFSKLLQPQRYMWAVLYLFIFLWECVKANFDVAYRVLDPGLPIKPGIVKVKLNVKTDMARTMLANSITMTPGTITVDIIDDSIFIHWIYVSSTDPERYSRKICGRFEKYIRRIFE